MRLSISWTVLGALVLSQASSAAKIILGNDDGWASANIRETYRLLKEAGNDVIMVAPVVDNSGQGGRSVFTTSRTLVTNGEFDSVAAGQPSLGSDPSDSHIWYYNGTPAACTFIALDYVAPQIWGPNVTADLLVAGPNVGQNLGPFLYTLSGTMGATYAAVGRGIPAIAFSAAPNGGQRYYKWVNQTTQAGLKDPATISAQLTVDLVQKLIKSTNHGERILPVGYGINVNYPPITSFTNDSCINPPFVQTRMTGGAFTDKAVRNETTGLFTYANFLGEGVNRCINGDCRLPGETDVVNSGCQSAVSVFTVDYDAPLKRDTSKVQTKMLPLVSFHGGSAWKRHTEMPASVKQLESPLRHE
ncbi:acid phosphatase precursor [Pseudovirgaria hyperparasitica]|uniref:Acid phosphatase n=1 Tax=Pseudovirgaria hyperparasitica TaxID=470096 RepID=A0A6A6WK68_9PEZI|nr:acid phosphatase precursor [Pseudovirgaria hyperparasitica]KAF2762561.1 acid phosphatase precursor [Pseudovirgaria hyperparasitica]